MQSCPGGWEFGCREAGGRSWSEPNATHLNAGGFWGGLSPAFPPLQLVGRRSRTARATSPPPNSPTDTLPTCTASGGSPSPPERRYQPPAQHRRHPTSSQPSSPSLPQLLPFFRDAPNPSIPHCPVPCYGPGCCRASPPSGSRCHLDRWHPARPSTADKDPLGLLGGGLTPLSSPPHPVPNLRSS